MTQTHTNGSTTMQLCVVCSEIDVYLPSFSHSYLEYDGRFTSSLSIFTDIEIVFRASSADGLLLYSGPLLTLNSWPWHLITTNANIGLLLTQWPWPWPWRHKLVDDWRSAAVQRLHRWTQCRLHLHFTDARTCRVQFQSRNWLSNH